MGWGVGLFGWEVDRAVSFDTDGPAFVALVGRDVKESVEREPVDVIEKLSS